MDGAEPKKDDVNELMDDENPPKEAEEEFGGCLVEEVGSRTGGGPGASPALNAGAAPRADPGVGPGV